MRNKVAISIFELQYIVARWKSGKSGIFHKADDFDFLMSRGDPYYQFYKNAPMEEKLLFGIKPNEERGEENV